MKQEQTGPELEKAVEIPAEEAGSEAAKKAEDKQKRHRRRMRALRAFLFRLVALAIVIYVLFFHIIGLTLMPNGDMYPRLDAGDLLLFYRVERAPRLRDIVVARKAENGQEYVLRVVACPGDTVEITDESGLRVNGNSLIESDIFRTTQPYESGIEFPVTLKEGEYFLMADLRNGGMDSRYFGPVRTEEIEGIVITVLRRNNL